MTLPSKDGMSFSGLKSTRPWIAGFPGMVTISILSTSANALFKKAWESDNVCRSGNQIEEETLKICSRDGYTDTRLQKNEYEDYAFTHATASAAQQSSKVVPTRRTNFCVR